MRRLPLLLVGLVALSAPALGDESAPEAHAFLEVVTPREQVFVGEPFGVSLRLGVDRAFFAEHAVELFRRPLDLPVQVEAPWLEGFDGARALDDPEPDRVVRLAVAGRETAATFLGTQRRGAVDFEVFAIARRFLPETPGPLTFAATLRFGYATRFEEDFLGGRLAVDRRDVSVRAAPLAIEVREPPEEGRPAAFAGAVGRYTVSAELAPAGSGAEDALAFALTIRGEGNLAFVEPPPPERLAGFHVYGLVDDRGAPVRTVVYEIAPLPGTKAVPPVPFAFFDPGPPAGYHVARTQPIPLAAPAPGASEPAEQAPDGVRPWVWWGGLAALLVAAAAALALGRRGAARRRTRTPRTPWSSRLAAEDADPADVLVGALSAHLGVAPAAVVGPDLADRLVAAGVDVALAARAATTAEALVGARFRPGSSPSDVRPALADLLDALDASFGHERSD